MAWHICSMCLMAGTTFASATPVTLENLHWSAGQFNI